MDENEINERNPKSAPPPRQKGTITLHEAIDFGEYQPNYLETFAEWHALSPHIQWQLIRKALDIRHRQLITQYAELSNALDLSQKPHVQAAMDKVQDRIRELNKDREWLYVEYSNKV